MKRWLCAVLVLGLLGLRAGAISARSAIVIDGLTGAVCFEQNADERLPMASTTKIMTALVVLEAGDDLDRTYEVAREYTLTEGSSMYLRVGETVTVRETLYGLLLMSGNDAALALAGEYGGTERFVALMNDKARALGLQNTHFDNPNGLDSEAHYTTARELAALTAYALQNDDFRELVSTRVYQGEGRTMVNHNRLLRDYEGCIGVKTGYTKRDGRCLVSAAERHGRRLIAVTLNDPDDWRDHRALLDAGFARYRERALQTEGEVLAQTAVYGGVEGHVPLVAGETVTAWLAEDEQPTPLLRGRRFSYAPVFDGVWFGTAEYRLGSVALGCGSVRYGGDVPRAPERESLWERLLDRLTGKSD